MDKHPMRANDNLATFDDFVEDLSNIDLSEQWRVGLVDLLQILASQLQL